MMKGMSRLLQFSEQWEKIGELLCFSFAFSDFFILFGQMFVEISLFFASLCFIFFPLWWQPIFYLFVLGQSLWNKIEFCLWPVLFYAFALATTRTYVFFVLFLFYFVLFFRFLSSLSKHQDLKILETVTWNLE